MKKNNVFRIYEFCNSKYIIILILFLCFFLLNNTENYLSLISYFKKNKPKISVFITIYNREKYIRKCIESIQNQTLKDIEIVAVNDCSNDSTLNILNDLAKNDHRIKIVNNDKNHGLLYSRAMGILNSSGDYIMNLDSDDEINDSESLEYLYNQTQNRKIDIIVFSFFFQKFNTIIKCDKINEIIFQPEINNNNFLPNNEVRDYLICNKLIKKEIFIQAYEILKIAIYNGKWNYFEDDVWNILIHKYSKSKLCLDRLVYIYNDNKNSLMNKRLSALEFQNLIYRHEMYKRIFAKKKDEKYLIAEYFYLFNRLKYDVKRLLLIKNNDIKNQIKDIFVFFLNNYNFTVEQKNDINDFLRKINTN